MILLNDFSLMNDSATKYAQFFIYHETKVSFDNERYVSSVSVKKWLFLQPYLYIIPKIMLKKEIRVLRANELMDRSFQKRVPVSL